MNELPLAYAFGAGLLATLNPCGFVMLPSFIAFYLGVHQPDYEQTPITLRLARALGVGGLVTAGFLTVFVFFGFLFSLGLRFFFAWVPYLTIVIALGLILVGLYLLPGRAIKLKLLLPLPQLQPKWSLRQRNKSSVYLYGISYAVVSLSCTLPVFFIVVGTAAAQPGPLASLVMFGAYGLGMGAVLVSVSVGAALFQGVVGLWLRALMPYVQRVSAVLLITMGLYLISLQLPYALGIDFGPQFASITNFISENLFLVVGAIGFVSLLSLWLRLRVANSHQAVISRVQSEPTSCCEVESEQSNLQSEEIICIRRELIRQV